MGSARSQAGSDRPIPPDPRPFSNAPFPDFADCAEPGAAILRAPWGLNFPLRGFQGQPGGLAGEFRGVRRVGFWVSGRMGLGEWGARRAGVHYYGLGLAWDYAVGLTPIGVGGVGWGTWGGVGDGARRAAGERVKVSGEVWKGRRIR
jgi:hypothetical protein